MVDLASPVRIPTLLLSLAAACAVSGCAANAFSEARRTDTAESYRRFLRDYPKDDNAEPARARLEDLELERARQLHTVLAYKRYLEEFPDSAGALKARALLEGLRFNAAQAEGSAAAYRQFLEDHPDGAHREEARKLLGEVEFKAAAAAKDPQALTRLLTAHPEDPRRPEVEARLDEAAFAEAKAQGPSRLLQYLEDFPAGAHREEAKVQLLSTRLEGLLVSGLLDEAREEARRSPLSVKLPELPARFAAAEALRAALQSPEPSVQGAFPRFYLRDFEDLVKALHEAPDPLQRWEAAEELGQHVSVRAIDPLLSALRTARNPLVRQKALESLGTVLRALPRAVADYEISLRLKALREGGQGADVSLAIAALLELSGRLEAAASEYQKAFDPGLPDPVILRRWVRIRQERHQAFSAAVAARQLALWAKGVAEDVELTGQGGVSPGLARQLCAAAAGVRDASRAVALARREKTEFPEDLVDFERQVEDARKRVEARLADAELLLRTRDPNAATCADHPVEERLRAALSEREAALRAVPGRAPRLARLVLEAAVERDPSLELRDRARALLADLPPAR